MFVKSTLQSTQSEHKSAKDSPSNEGELNPTLERIADPTSHSFAPCIEILGQTIPASEQLPLPRLTTLLVRGDYRLYSLSSNNEIVGMALLHLPEDRAFVWLDYMAIRPDRQRQRLGSQLFQKIVNLAHNERATADWLFLEVDDDREGPDEIRHTNKERIEFYQRLGAHLLVNVPYRFPSPTADPVPMRLMAYRLSPTGQLSPQAIGSAIEDIFLHIHGRDRKDLLLRSLLGLLPSALILD